MSTIKADNIATLAGVSTSMANAVNGSAKAWVNFKGTGTVSIYRSFNVSSITDNGTGDYTVNFTNAMSDQYFACSANGNVYVGEYYRELARRIDVPQGSGAVRLFTAQGAYDIDFCQCAIFS